MKKTLFTLLSIAALCAADSAVAQQGRRGRRAAAQTGGGRRAAAAAVQGRRGRGVAPVRQMPVYRAPVVQETVFQEEVTAQPMPTKQGYWDRAKGWISRNPKTAAGIGAGVAGAALLGGGAAAAYGTKGKYWGKPKSKSTFEVIKQEIDEATTLEYLQVIENDILNPKDVGISYPQRDVLNAMILTKKRILQEID